MSRHPRWAFSVSAAYVGIETVARPVFANLAPEMSRRARSLAVWATLRACPILTRARGR